MASTKQRNAARRNIKKTAAGAKKKRQPHTCPSRFVRRWGGGREGKNAEVEFMYSPNSPPFTHAERGTTTGHPHFLACSHSALESYDFPQELSLRL